MKATKAETIFYRLDFFSKLSVFLFVCLAAIYPFIAGNFTTGSLLCSGGMFTIFLFIYFPLVLLIILPISALVFHKIAFNLIKKGKAKFEKPKSEIIFKIMFIIGFLFSILWLVTFMLVSGARRLALFGKVGSDLNIISVAQGRYYEKYARYASTQEELVGDGALQSILADPYMHKEYADFDGSGIEGSDNNDRTWSVMMGVYEGAPSLQAICGAEKQNSNPKHYYLCDQQGCGAFKNGISCKQQVCN